MCVMMEFFNNSHQTVSALPNYLLLEIVKQYAYVTLNRLKCTLEHNLVICDKCYFGILFLSTLITKKPQLEDNIIFFFDKKDKSSEL